MVITDELLFLIKNDSINNIDNIIDVFESYNAESSIEMQIIGSFDRTIRYLDSNKFSEVKQNKDIPYFYYDPDSKGG